MKTIQSVLIVILVLIILFMKMCTPNNPINDVEPTVVYKDTVITFHDTIINHEVKWKTKTLVIHDTIIDTIEVINDYYSKVAYDDIIQIDTLGYILIEDTIYKNRIQYRAVSTYLKTPYIIRTKEVLTYRSQFYIGLGMTGNLNSLDAITGNLLFVTKRQKAFSFGAGINSDFEPIFTGRIYWNLR